MHVGAATFAQQRAAAVSISAMHCGGTLLLYLVPPDRATKPVAHAVLVQTALLS